MYMQCVPVSNLNGILHVQRLMLSSMHMCVCKSTKKENQSETLHANETYLIHVSGGNPSSGESN